MNSLWHGSAPADHSMATISHSRLHRLLSQRPVYFTPPSVCLCDLSCCTPSHSRHFQRLQSWTRWPSSRIYDRPQKISFSRLTCYPPCTQRLRYRSTPFNPNAIICRLVWISSRSGLPGTSVYGFHSTDACEGLSLVALSRFWPSHCTCPMS